MKAILKNTFLFGDGVNFIDIGLGKKFKGSNYINTRWYCKHSGKEIKKDDVVIKIYTEGKSSYWKLSYIMDNWGKEADLLKVKNEIIEIVSKTKFKKYVCAELI